MTVRITTWNVNGLRAVLGRNNFHWLESTRPDILCLQEIKSRPDQLGDGVQVFDPYYACWNPAERPGYSGVATFSDPPPVQTQLGLGIPEFDTEGRVIISRHPGFLLFNVYFPNGQRGLGRLTYKLDFYQNLLELCSRLQAAGENLVICGDFNTAHQEIDLKNPRANQKTSGFLPEERAWIDRYLEHGLVDVYRRLYPERVEYTWWTYIGGARTRNVGWRLDYFMVSEGLMPKVVDTVIHNEIMGSDHCPVSLVLDL